MSATLARQERPTKYRRWTEALVIAAIKRWHRKHKEPPRRSDWDVAYARLMSERALAKAADWSRRAAEYEASDEWPPSRHVSDLFGTWNAAIEAAGLTPRAQGQHTRRGYSPSPRMALFGHIASMVYEAEARRDEEALRVALGRLIRFAERIIEGAVGDEIAELEMELRDDEQVPA